MIVGKENFEVVAIGNARQNGLQGLVERLNVLLFIEDRNENGDEPLRNAFHLQQRIVPPMEAMPAMVQAGVARPENEA